LIKDSTSSLAKEDEIFVSPDTLRIFRGIFDEAAKLWLGKELEARSQNPVLTCRLNSRFPC
ncbi:MAG: hypothetical protein AAGE59_30995, partial [Cyanobacteria bacterium P01_F01_bin.86]